MSLADFLRPKLQALYVEHSDISTEDATAELRRFMEAQPEGDCQLDECVDSAIASVWRKYIRDARGVAVKALKHATLTKTPSGPGLRAWMQTRLPLADPQHAPIIAVASVALLRESNQYLARMERGVSGQRRRQTELARQLETAADATRKPAITVREADGLGFIDWDAIGAA